MDWLKLTSNGILRGSLAQSRDVVQLTWIKLLALMNETHFRNGRFEYAMGKPYSLDFIAMSCGITRPILEGCIAEYQEDINPNDGLPRVYFDSETLVLTNWAKYQDKKQEDEKKKLPLSDEALDKMNVRRQVKNPELTIKGATLQGKAVLDMETGGVQQDSYVLSQQELNRDNQRKLESLRERGRNV